MLAEPQLDREALLEAVRTSYGVSPVSLRFIPVGWTSVSYDLRTDDTRYFLKLTDQTSRLPLVRRLHELGFRARLPYPVETLDGRLSAHTPAGEAVLSPFLPGTTPPGWPRWSDAVLDELGQVLADLHATPPPVPLPQEQFAFDVVPDLPAAVLTRLQQLQYVVRRLPQQLVLCHTDLIGDNLLVDEDGTLSALDWDDAKLAPPESDLALLLHGEQPVDDHALRRVLSVYPGPLEIDRFAFFLLRRYAEDYSARVRRLEHGGLSPADLEETREGMVTWGSAQWSRLDRTLDVVRAALDA
jgi:Ser/Thr protein kinase RdoA (MazF antagonist)